jgi:hypothetical protein
MKESAWKNGGIILTRVKTEVDIEKLVLMYFSDHESHID